MCDIDPLSKIIARKRRLDLLKFSYYLKYDNYGRIMLKISKSVEYSIFALKQIYNNQNSNLLVARDIAEKENIPAELVAKLLQKLKRNGILESVQGKFGGYRFATTPSKITLYSVVEAIDLEIQITDCLCDNATKQDCERIDNCSLRNPFSKLQDEIITLMKNLKLTDLFI